MNRLAARAVLPVLAVLVLAAGCGGSSKKSSSPPASTTATSATTGANTHTTGSGSTSGAAGGPGSSPAATFASSGHCALLRALGAKVSQAVPTTFRVSRTDIAAEVAALTALGNSAPPEIRGDFRTYIDVFGRYMRAYARVGLRPGKAPTRAQYAEITRAATEAVNTPGLGAAEQNLKHWVRAHCPKVHAKP